MGRLCNISVKNDKIEVFEKSLLILSHRIDTGIYDMFPQYCQIVPDKHTRIFDEKKTNRYYQNTSENTW
jgi:hypothetical protein